jgi:hypothetical protein
MSRSGQKPTNRREPKSTFVRFTPQALTILADHDSWPTFRLGNLTSIDAKITSDYLAEFAQAYASTKGIVDRGTVGRIQHAINELTSGRFIEARVQQSGAVRCVLTDIGQTLLQYIRASE